MKYVLMTLLAFSLSGCLLVFHPILEFDWDGPHHHHVAKKGLPHVCEPYPRCFVDDSGMRP
jgi:hypothetical protein